MALPGKPGPGYGQQQHTNIVPKSVFLDKTYNPPNLHPNSPGESHSLRVTFANKGSPQKPQQSAASSLASFHQNVYNNGKLRSPATPPPRNAVEEIQRKLRMYPKEDVRPQTAPEKEMIPEVPEAAGRSKPNPQRKSKSKTGPVDVLYPDKKNKPKLDVGSSSGVLPSSKSVESVTKKPKNKDVSTKTGASKKTSRRTTNKSSVSSSISRRTKSGKKLKKRKKSKFDDELEKELKKPVELNQEYAQEINKITQILKAVTAFDESTSTENGSINGSPLGSNNVASFYTFSGGSRTLTGATSSLRASPRRPFSGDEIKQLLSSITKVVSLHKISLGGVSDTMSKPVNVVPTAGPTAIPPRTPIGSEDGAGPAPGPMSTISTATTRGRRKKVKKVKRPKSPSYVGGSQSDPTHSRRKPSSSPSPGPSSGGKIKSKSIAGTTNTTKPNTTITTTTQPQSQTTSKGKRAVLVRPNSDESEPDPVKHAAFLRKYFEESLRLANKRSSEDMIRMNATRGAGGEGNIVQVRGIGPPPVTHPVINMDDDEDRQQPHPHQRKSLRNKSLKRENKDSH